MNADSDDEGEENISREMADAQDDFLEECQKEMEATASRKRSAAKAAATGVAAEIRLAQSIALCFAQDVCII